MEKSILNIYFHILLNNLNELKYFWQQQKGQKFPPCSQFISLAILAPAENTVTDPQDIMAQKGRECCRQ